MKTRITAEQREHIELWVKDLRSGKKRQTKGALFDGRGYCCLGVACATYRREVGGKWRRNPEEAARIFEDATQEENASILPRDVKSWLGIDAERMDIYVTMNDSYDATFKQIADRVEIDYLRG